METIERIDNTTPIVPQIGDKMKIRDKYRLLYIDKFMPSQLALTDGDIMEEEATQLERNNTIYNSKLTIKEYKQKVEFPPFLADVVYFEEVPNTPHLAHHFELIINT